MMMVENKQARIFGLPVVVHHGLPVEEDKMKREEGTMIEQVIGPLAAGAISALISGVGVYVAMSRRLAVLETKMDNIYEQNKLLNNLLSKEAELDKRITVVENDRKTIWTRHDELKERVDVLERKG